MRAIVHTETGDSSALQLVDRPIPTPGPGEIRVRVVVSGVNPTDWKNRRGATANSGEGGETVPNQDGSGIVDAIGDGVEEFAIGDRVWLSLAAYQRPASGTAQEFTVVPVGRAFALPGNASFDDGASIGIPALTAHRALTSFEGAPTRLEPGALSGSTILVAGGAGAVGNSAIQLAHWAGATVITTVSGDAKAALARSAGADHVVTYTEPDAAAQIRAIAPDGIDLVVEVAAGRNMELDHAVLATRGTVAIYANDGDRPFALEVRPNMVLNARYQFVLLYTMGAEAIRNGASAVNAAIEAGALRFGEDAGVPFHHFELEQAAAAHEAVEAGAVGKVLIHVAAAE
jgi:NADPH2:quinone reductase